jgi:hypothetical protein
MRGTRFNQRMFPQGERMVVLPASHIDRILVQHHLNIDVQALNYSISFE